MIRFRYNDWRHRTSMRPAISLRLSIAILVAVFGLYALFVAWAWHRGGKGGLIGALAAAPLAGVFATPALIGLFPAWIAWVERRIWQPWQGRYYAFDDRQIRIVEARDRLWFSSADVHAALRLKPRTALLDRLARAERRTDDEIGDALSNAGLERLFALSTDPRVRRFLLWSERDVRKPWRNKRDRDVRPIVQNPDA